MRDAAWVGLFAFLGALIGTVLRWRWRHEAMRLLHEIRSAVRKQNDD